MDILRAYKIACQLHAGQTDKAGRPYIEHLTRVLLRVQMDGGDRFQQIAALLHDPTGLLFGHYDWIAKWRNLTPAERAQLHGTMSGDFREGPVVISLKPDAVAEHGQHLVMPVPEAQSG